MSERTDAPDGPPVVTLDAGDLSLEIELLRAVARSDDAEQAALGQAGIDAFDKAREGGQGIQSALGLAKLAMVEHRNGAGA